VKKEMDPFVERARRCIGRLKAGISLIGKGEIVSEESGSDEEGRDAADAERLAERRLLEERMEAVRLEQQQLERLLAEDTAKGNRKRGRSPASSKSSVLHTRSP
jgi:hypothetical protein